MQVRFEPDALSELAGAMDWYAARSGAAGRTFVAEIEHVIERLRESPLRWPTYLHGTRRALLRRFPFALVYRVGNDQIQVIAVTHLHRRPGYWRNRPLG